MLDPGLLEMDNRKGKTWYFCLCWRLLCLPMQVLSFHKFNRSPFTALFPFLCVLTAEAQGLPCEFNGRVYQHSEDFQSNCQHQCTCMDGVVGCMPLCPHQVPLPDRRCSQPRLARPEGSCCDEWVCDDDNHIKEEPDELTQTSLLDNQPLPNHISALLQAQPQTWHPALTRGTTYRGKHCIPLTLFLMPATNTKNGLKAVFHVD